MIRTADDILSKLTSFDRQNYDEVTKVKDTTPSLEYVADMLDSEGIKVQFQEYMREGVDSNGNKLVIKRKNLIAKVHEKEDIPTVGFEGHIDTVPFGNYRGNPLGEENKDRVYGRGVVDMSGSLAGMIKAAMLSKKIRNPSANIELIITSDEEAHNFEGIKRYIQGNPTLDMAICGEPTGMAIRDRFKGALYHIIEIPGKSGHGSRQHEGENAIVKGYPVVEALLYLYEEVPKIINPDFVSEDKYSHQSSMNIGTITAGTKVNVIPDKMRIEFEMRLVYPAQKYVDLITKTLKPHEKIISNMKQVFAKDPTIAELNESNFFYGRLNRLSNKRLVALGFSEATFLNDASIPTIQFGIGDNSMSHTDEEYINKKDLAEYTEKLLNFVS